MVSIGKLGVGQERYYIGKVAEGAEDYYSGEGEAQGYWLGEGAAELGLDGKVGPAQLGAMLRGLDPATGEPLGLKSAPTREPVPGFDLTFSAPKSVSLTWALGGHPVSSVVMEAHRAAVAEGLAYFERNACWARRGKGGAVFVKGQGFIAAAYPHRSSRAGDPQLHTHVLIANATLGPDGRWSRLYHPAIYEHAKTASYIYEAHLRWELTQRLGVEWEPVVKGIADIKGFRAEELERFSTRRAEIIEAAGEGASAREMQIATLTTRRAKDRDITSESLREAWREKGAEIGLTRELIGRRLGHERPGSSVLSAQAVERSVTEHASRFERREVVRAVADNLPNGAPALEVEELADAFLASDSVVEIAATPRGPRYTTERIWKLEQRALAAAGEMHAAEGFAVLDPILVCRVLDARPSLKADQRAMVERLLGEGRGLEIVIGEAGSGKTYATVAAASGWSAAGCELLAAAPTWRAANVLRAEGLEAQTAARLLARMDERVEAGRPALRPGAVVIVDEAGMVDSQSLARLIDHAHQADAKLVLTGDPAQLGEIEAGGLFAAIANRSDPIHLDEVIRHRHDLDREAAKLIREGRGSEAVERYAREGRVVVAADQQARRQAIVSDWHAAKERGENALMIAKLNSERARLNELAREAMRADGRLGREEIEIAGQCFAAGDEVITRVNDQRAQVFNRERWRVEAVEVENQTLRLAGIDTNRQVGVDSGYLRKVNPADGAPALEHGYAATIYQAQGATLDSAYVMADPSIDRQEFYVAASRTRGETFFYATPEVGFQRIEFAPAEADAVGLEHIARAAERDGAQAAAHDAALREQLARLSTPELYARRHELASDANAEARSQRDFDHLARNLEVVEGKVGRLERQCEALGEEPAIRSRSERRSWRERAERLEESLDLARIDAAEMRAKLAAEAKAIDYRARAEQAVAEQLISERIAARMTAVKIDPPDYLTRELGQRPSDPTKRFTWDEAASGIETYRQKHGIGDRDSTLGAEPRDSLAQVERKRAQKSLEHAQRQLRLQRDQARAIEQSRSIEIEM